MNQNSQSATENMEIVSDPPILGLKTGSRGPQKKYSEEELKAALARVYPNQTVSRHVRQVQNHVKFYQVVDYLEKSENWSAEQEAWKASNLKALWAYISTHRTLVSKLGHIETSLWIPILIEIVRGDGKKPYSSATAAELIRIYHPNWKVAYKSETLVMRRRVELAIKYFRRVFPTASDGEIAEVFKGVSDDVICELVGSSTPKLNLGP